MFCIGSRQEAGDRAADGERVKLTVCRQALTTYTSVGNMHEVTIKEKEDNCFCYGSPGGIDSK